MENSEKSENVPTEPSESLLERISSEKFRNFSTAIIIPLVVLIVGGVFTCTQKDKEIKVKYIEIAAGILREKPPEIKESKAKDKDTDKAKNREPEKDLNDWAVKIIDKYCEVKLSENAKDALKTKEIHLSDASSSQVVLSGWSTSPAKSEIEELIINEEVEKTIKRLEKAGIKVTDEDKKRLFDVYKQESVGIGIRMLE